MPEFDGCEQKVEVTCAYLRSMELERNWKERVPKVLSIPLGQFAEIFASQGAPPLSTTPVANVS